MQKPLYKTELGKYYVGNSEELLVSGLGKKLKNKIQLILTSPPFPLNKKKNMETYREKIIKNGLST